MVTIRPMGQTDIPSALRVWQETSGRSRPVDTADGLAHNPGLSQVAEQHDQRLGVLVGGQDGRGGLPHHVGVVPPVRRHGLGRALVDCDLAALKEQGIVPPHLMLQQGNAVGLRFWKSFGCRERANMVVISLLLPTDATDHEGAE